MESASSARVQLATSLHDLQVENRYKTAPRVITARRKMWHERCCLSITNGNGLGVLQSLLRTETDYHDDKVVVRGTVFRWTGKGGV